jgi:hypothetical protein
MTLKENEEAGVWNDQRDGNRNDEGHFFCYSSELEENGTKEIGRDGGGETGIGIQRGDEDWKVGVEGEDDVEI